MWIPQRMRGRTEGDDIVQEEGNSEYTFIYYLTRKPLHVVVSS